MQKARHLRTPCEPVLPRVFPSQRRVAGLGAVACLLAFFGGGLSPAWAQLHKPAPAPAPAQSEAPKDSLGRSTPRGAVLGFLTVARNGEDELATQYLDTGLRGKAAAVLAHQLFVVLDRRLPPRLNQLSDLPEGSASDPLNPDQELVGAIRGDNQNVNILLERVNRGKFGPLWLFSSKTLDAIPDLYDEVNEVSVDHFLPDFLITTRLAGIALFEWLAVLVGMPSLYFLTVLLSRLLNRLFSLVRGRLSRNSNPPKPDFLPSPVRLLVLAFFIRWASSKVSLPLLARQFWSSTAIMLTIGASVWLLILIVSWGEQYTRRLLRNRNLTGSTSVLHLIRWVVDLLIICAGMFATLHYFGMSPTTALAGLGVGGVAIAFAAQKTLENVIGGVSLIFDQAVRVGDILKVGDSQGTVEDIGLRSTRIRTPDRTVIIVPNSQIANMTLESFSSRDKFWFHPIPALSYRTNSTQLCAVLEGIRGLLEKSQHLEASSVRVRFLRFAPSSLDVEIFAYVWAGDWNQFLKIQEFLLLRIMDCIESSGVQFAFPLQTEVAAALARDAASGSEIRKVPTPEENINEAATASNSV